MLLRFASAFLEPFTQNIMKKSNDDDEDDDDERERTII